MTITIEEIIMLEYMIEERILRFEKTVNDVKRVGISVDKLTPLEEHIEELNVLKHRLKNNFEGSTLELKEFLTKEEIVKSIQDINNVTVGADIQRSGAEKELILTKPIQMPRGVKSRSLDICSKCDGERKITYWNKGGRTKEITGTKSGCRHKWI